jgi:hypothetical protein
MTTPTLQLATALGLRFLGLIEARTERGANWSVRVTTSWCSNQPIYVVTLIHTDKAGNLRYEPFVGSDILALLDSASRKVEGKP